MNRNRSTYCTYKNFANMYGSVYDKMVEAGVAVKFEKELMFDKERNKTNDPEKMYGRPLKYMIARPDRCVFVDETG
jgi:hypothetical protein